MNQIKTLTNISLSVLDLSAVTEGSTVRNAFQNSMELAQHAEKLGYKRHG